MDGPSHWDQEPGKTGIEGKMHMEANCGSVVVQKEERKEENGEFSECYPAHGFLKTEFCPFPKYEVIYDQYQSLSAFPFLLCLSPSHRQSPEGVTHL